MLNLFIKEPDGNYSSISVDSNMNLNIKDGQQLYFDSYYESFTVSLVDGDKSVKIVFELAGEQVTLVLNNMANLIKQSGENDSGQTVLSVITDVEGILDLQETVFNTNFSGDDVIAALKEKLLASAGEKAHGVVIDSFGSLFSALEASAAGGNVATIQSLNLLAEENFELDEEDQNSERRNLDEEDDDSSNPRTSRDNDSSDDSSISSLDLSTKSTEVIDSSTSNSIDIKDDSKDNIVSSSELSSTDILGVVEAGSTIDSIKITDGTNTITLPSSSITLNADGTYTANNIDLSTLNDGTLTSTIVSTDIEGNTASSSDTIVKDVVVSSPTLSLDESKDSDSTPNQTNDLTPKMLVTTDSDLFKIEISSSAGVVAVASRTSLSASWNFTGTGLSRDASGKFFYEAPTQKEENVTFTSKVTDHAGNTNTDSITFKVEVATVTEITINSITSDNKLEYNEIINASGDVITQDLTGTVSSNFGAGDTVKATINNIEYTGTVDLNGTTWTIDNVSQSDLAFDPNFTVEVVSTDSDGLSVKANNTSTHTIDISELLINFDGDVDNKTDDTTPDINGLVENNAQSVKIFTVVGGVYTEVGSDTVSAGKFDATLTTLAPGGHTLAVKSYDSSNNEISEKTIDVSIQGVATGGGGPGVVLPSLGTPIILDLDGDGVETISKANGTQFDIDADGDLDTTGWVGADDALLVRDINEDGVISNASELFGEEMIKADGTKASDGYDALREYDSNADGVINADDENFDQLKIWQDSNENGITDAGELKTLSEAGIVEINTSTITSTETQFGNELRLKSDYTNAAGEVKDAADVYFSYDENTGTAALSEDTQTTYFVINLPTFNTETTLTFDFKGEGNNTPEINYMEYSNDFSMPISYYAFDINGQFISQGILEDFEAIVPAGTASLYLQFDIQDDDKIEETERIEFTVSGEYIADITLSTDVADNDAVVNDLPDMSVGYEYIMEDNENGVITFTVSIDKASDQDITFSYNTNNEGAVGGEDYDSVTGTITIPAGQTSVDIVVPITNDMSAEDLEYFYMNIEKPSGETNYNIVDPQSSAKIFSDDIEPRSLNIDSSIITESTTEIFFDVKLDEAYTSDAVIEFNFDTNISGLLDANGHALDVDSVGKSNIFSYSTDNGATWQQMRFDADYFDGVENFIWIPKNIDSFIVRVDVSDIDLSSIEDPSISIDLFSDTAIVDNRVGHEEDDSNTVVHVSETSDSNVLTGQESNFYQDVYLDEDTNITDNPLENGNILASIENLTNYSRSLDIIDFKNFGFPISDDITPEQLQIINDAILSVGTDGDNNRLNIPSLEALSTIISSAIPPEGSISVDNITDDDIINAAEAEDTINISGTVSGRDIQSGDEITLVVNTTTYTTTVLANMTWNVNVAGSDLKLDTDFDINVSSKTIAGTDVDFSVNSTHSFNDSATISIDSVETLTEGTVSVGSKVANYTTNDVENDSLTISVEPSSYYTVLNGEVLLTQVGANEVNAGNNLPEFIVSVTDGIQSIISTDSAAPTATIDVNDDLEVTLSDVQTVVEDDASTVAGKEVATINVTDEEGDATLTLENNADGYYAISNGKVVLTEDGANHVNGGGTLPEIEVKLADADYTDTAKATPTTTATNDDLEVTLSDVQTVVEDDASTVAGKEVATINVTDEEGDATLTLENNADGYYAISNGKVVLTEDGANHVNGGGTLPEIEVKLADADYTDTAKATPITDVLPEITINDTILTNDNTPTFSGTSENTDGDFTLNVNGKDYTVTPAANGTWSFTIPEADALDDGNYTATISGSDAQGNNVSANDALTVDADAPDITKLAITDIVDTNGDHSEIIMSGTADEAGNTVKLYDEDDNYLGSTTVLEDGTWSFDITNLENTPRNDNEFFKVTETDGAGNVTAETPAVHFNAFTWNNAQSDDFDDYALAGSGNDTFTVNNNDISNRIVFDGGDGTDTIVLNGNRANFDISVNENGDIVIVDNTNTTGDTVIVRNTEVFKFDDGVFNDETVLTGNLPEITINDTGLINDDTPTFNGTSQNTAGDFVLSVNGKDYNVTPESNGTWSFTIPAVDALDDGNYTATIKGSDGQGNQTSASDGLSIDATAPDINDLKITDIVDNEGDYSSVTMKGTGAEVGNTVTLYNEDGDAVGTTEVQADGTWNLSIENQSGTPINDNEFYSVTETDSVGNTTAQTNSTHYWHGSSSNINTESSDDYVMTGSGNDRINTDDVLSGTNENGYVTSTNDDTNDSLVIDAGDGTDTVSFGKDIEEYTITTDSTGNVIVTESIQSDSNDDGKGDVTELRNVETIEFNDGTYDVQSGVFTSYNVAPVAVDDTAMQENVFLGTKEEDGSISQWGAQNTDGSLTHTTENGHEITISATRNGASTAIGFMDDDLDDQKGVGIGAVGGNDAQLELNETLSIDFAGTVGAGTEIGIAGLGGHFVDTHAADAKAIWKAYDTNGTLVASGELQQDNDDSEMTNSFIVDVAFSSIEFEVLANINSNFTIQYIEANYIDTNLVNDEDSTLIIQAQTLLSNDSDSNDDTLTIVDVSATENTHGEVSIDVNGNVVFVPDENYFGEASFTYTISDGNGKSDTASVTLQINSVNDAPIIDSLATQVVLEDGTLSGEIIANDVEGDEITFMIEPGAVIPEGLILNSNGTYTFDASSYDSLDFGQAQNILVPIVVSDEHGATSTTTLNIKVEGLNNDLTFVSERAGYDNVVGYYEVDSDGNPLNPAVVVIINQNTTSSGEHLSDLNPDTNYGFFIIAGYDADKTVDENSVITFDTTTAIPTLLIDGTSSTYPVYHDNPAFNSDGKDHFIFTSDGEGGTTIKIEDLPNLGDADFDDLVLHLNYEISDKTLADFAGKVTLDIEVVSYNVENGTQGSSTNVGDKPAGLADIENITNNLNNTINFNEVNNKKTYGNGDENVHISGNMNKEINLGNGNNTLEVDGNSDKIKAGSGSDTVNIDGNQNKDINLGSGDNRIDVDGNAAKIEVGSGDDKIRVGGNSYKTISMGDGDNILDIEGNTEKITAGSGDDTVIIGGNAYNEITLGSGSDTVYIEGNSHEEIQLDSGNDIITIQGNIYDDIDGGAGIDSIVLGSYTKADYDNNVNDIQNKLENFENFKFSDGEIIGDSSVFHESEVNYETTISILATQEDVNETLSEVSILIPDNVTTVKDENGNELSIEDGRVSLPVQTGVQASIILLSESALSSSDINTIEGSVTTREINGDISTATDSIESSLTTLDVVKEGNDIVNLGNDGAGYAYGYAPDDIETQVFDFGVLNAGKTVTLSFDSTATGTWDNAEINSSITVDKFIISINDVEEETLTYNHYTDSNNTWNESKTYTGVLNEEGKLEVSFNVKSTYNQEIVNITDIEVELKDALVDGTYSTPIILDLDGDGIETISLANGTEFDIDNDGDIDLTGWVGADDGLLVRDINNDGIINDASELFGEETIKEDGRTASDGYDALRELDSNEDGVINDDDDAFSELKIWQDGNSDGITDEGELLGLKEANVSEISLGTITSNETSNGNVIGLKSTYLDNDGKEQEVADVWFEIEAKDLVLDDDIDLVSAKVEPEVDQVALNNQNVDLKGVLSSEEEEYIIFGEKENSISLQESDLKWVKHDENEIIDDEEFKVFESTFSPNSHIKIFIDSDIDVDL